MTSLSGRQGDECGAGHDPEQVRTGRAASSVRRGEESRSRLPCVSLGALDEGLGWDQRVPQGDNALRDASNTADGREESVHVRAWRKRGRVTQA